MSAVNPEMLQASHFLPMKGSRVQIVKGGRGIGVFFSPILVRTMQVGSGCFHLPLCSLQKSSFRFESVCVHAMKIG